MFEFVKTRRRGGEETARKNPEKEFRLSLSLALSPRKKNPSAFLLPPPLRAIYSFASLAGAADVAFFFLVLEWRSGRGDRKKENGDEFNGRGSAGEEKVDLPRFAAAVCSLSIFKPVSAQKNGPVFLAFRSRSFSKVLCFLLLVFLRALVKK